MKTCSESLIIREIQIKIKWNIISRQSEWPPSRSLQTINAGEGVEKREPSYTVGGNAVLGVYPENSVTQNRHMYPSLHCSTIYNSQDMKAT